MLTPVKPPALRPGDAVRIVSLSSPPEPDPVRRGCQEIIRLGYRPLLDSSAVLAQDSYFAGSASQRLAAFQQAVAENESRAIFCTRGGYGSTYLLENLNLAAAKPKIFCAFSDLTALQIYLWQKFRWVTFYAPMVAGALQEGPGAPGGYHGASFANALSGSQQTWTIDLAGEPLVEGTAEGILLGGCISLIQTTLGTPWALDTRGSILLLEDVKMQPYHVDRALMHLQQAGKFAGIKGIILGDFPVCDPQPGSASVRDIATRILGPLGIPIVWGAAVGHTNRPMRTLPLGVRCRLLSADTTQLEILEPACIA